MLDQYFLSGEAVSGGSLKVKLQYSVFGFPLTVLDDSFDLCGSQTGLSCPLSAGLHSFQFSNEVPSAAPGVSQSQRLLSLVYFQK